ncbi:hypothetical protein WJX84_011325 [Apatococcus fuscideae]|uniref:Phosphatidate cytidylyltransferase n=1 Tax=Apatococcus fuscideae TaxID=2026836 RepID=A0AAW1T5W4_9CHLO
MLPHSTRIPTRDTHSASIKATAHKPLCLTAVKGRCARPPQAYRTRTLFNRPEQPSQAGPHTSCSSNRQRQPRLQHSRPVLAIAANSGALGAAAQDAAKLPRQTGQPALSKLALRATAGSVLGIVGAAVILAGGWTFTLVTCLVTYQASQEFFGFVTSQGITAGMDPPPPAVSALTSLMCIALTVWTHVSLGKSTAALAVSSFIVLSLQLFATEKPRFAQLASSVFGLFYCGYLPSFWVKLRLLSAPAISSTAVHQWPVMLGGLTHWTVGLVATIMAVACVIAADTGAYICGSLMGRTQLISLSPKKTVEGAVGGALCSISTALCCWRVFAWPASPWVAIALGTVVFFASLFGDLIESVMKRDAGLKDASDLIPGHGGLLDRFDSYIFTGAIMYFILKFIVPMFGL